MDSLHPSMKVTSTILPAAHAAGTVNGTAVDRKGHQEALVVVHSGANGENGTVTIKVQESDVAGSGFADIPGAAFGQITTANDETVYVGRINLASGSRKRYLRAVATVDTAACVFGVSIILGSFRDLPVSQVNPVAFSV